MVIGRPKAAVGSGGTASGASLLMQAHIGRILTTTTIRMVGMYMRATGLKKTAAIITGTIILTTKTLFEEGPAWGVSQAGFLLHAIS